MVSVPGDNDIGGEGAEPVRQDKVDLFRAVFGGIKDTALVDFVQFYKVRDGEGRHCLDDTSCEVI